MAVTFHQEPQVYTPSDNNVLWTFSSDQTGQPNFEYKIELFVDSVLVYVGKTFPINGAVSYFNAVQILRGIVPEPTINSSPTVTTGDASELSFENISLRDIYLRVTERYGTPIEDEASADSATNKVWKASLNELGFIDFDYLNYQIQSETSLFMTNFPRNRQYLVTNTQNIYLSIITGNTSNLEAKYITFDDADSIDVNNLDLPFINVGIPHLQTVNGSNIEQFLEVWLQKVDDINSETFRFDIVTPCNEHTTVFFLNKLGGVDSWTFTAAKQVNSTFDRNEYQKKLGRLVGNQYVYDKFDGRHRAIHNTNTTTETLNSDWLYPDVHAWLVRELLESPMVWTEDEDGVKTRYVVTNSQSRQGQDATDIWMQLSLELKPTFQSYSTTL